MLSYYKHYLKYILKWAAISIIIGIITGSAAAFFLYTLDIVTNYRESNVWIIAFLPIGGFLIGLMYHYWGEEANSGNNLIIENIQKPKPNIITWRMAPFVYIGTMVSHLLGGSAGREGTAVQMAGSLMDQFSKPFNLNESDRKILLKGAVAAGFGSVFGTPLAGAIFALEFIKIGKINYKALFTVFLSSILADLITKAWNIPHTHYVIDFVPALDIFTLIYIFPAGIAFGLCAFLFSTSMHWTSGLYKKHISYAPFRPLIGGTVVALGVYFVGHTRFIGLGIPSIVSSFKVLLHPTDWFAKILFTVATLSAGFKGGEVTPLFYIGATLGNALSYIIPLPTALLAGMGFVAVFAGATNTPLACIIMAIELFGVECGVYTALACVIAYGVSAYTSIYTSQLLGITKNGIRVGDNIRIKDLMK